MAQQNHPTKTQDELFCSSSEESHDDSIIDKNYENKTDSSESSEITSDSSQNSLILKKELIVKNAESSSFQARISSESNTAPSKTVPKLKITRKTQPTITDKFKTVVKSRPTWRDVQSTSNQNSTSQTNDNIQIPNWGAQCKFFIYE